MYSLRLGCLKWSEKAWLFWSQPYSSSRSQRKLASFCIAWVPWCSHNSHFDIFLNAALITIIIKKDWKPKKKKRKKKKKKKKQFGLHYCTENTQDWIIPILFTLRCTNMQFCQGSLLYKEQFFPTGTILAPFRSFFRKKAKQLRKRFLLWKCMFSI